MIMFECCFNVCFDCFVFAFFKYVLFVLDFWVFFDVYGLCCNFWDIVLFSLFNFLDCVWNLFCIMFCIFFGGVVFF